MNSKALKLIMPLMAALFGITLFSCSSDGINIDYNVKKTNDYAQDWHEWATKNSIGNIASNQTWGDWNIVIIDTNAVTKSANPNSNQWSDFSVVPTDLTDGQRTKIMEFFGKTDIKSMGTSVNWSDFYVQQVGNGNYKTKNYMNKLICSNGKNGTEHVNNFNANTPFNNKMLMQDCSTEWFGYHDSRHSQDEDKFICINGAVIDESLKGRFFIGFDYEDNKGNRDYIFNDWVIGISPCEYTKGTRVICEDMGTKGDFDFNDLVFDVVSFYDYSKRRNDYIITLRAVGGTIEAFIGGVEAHEAMGIQTATMVNTGRQIAPIAIFRIHGKYKTIRDIPISCKDNKGEWILTCTDAHPTQLLAVTLDYKWCKEQVPITDAYPLFKEYVSKPSIEWQHDVNLENVIY